MRPIGEFAPTQVRASNIQLTGLPLGSTTVLIQKSTNQNKSKKEDKNVGDLP